MDESMTYLAEYIQKACPNKGLKFYKLFLLETEIGQTCRKHWLVDITLD